MLTVKQAKELILKNAPLQPAEKILLNKASGRILAEDILSPVSHPLFDQSAVDGYAIQYNDLNEHKKVLLEKGEIKAGDFPEYKIKPGETMRIFTGAAVPQGADTVVMQEFVEKNGAFIQIQDNNLKKGANIRKKGEQIKTGQLALAKGTTLNPAGIGFLASLGIYSVKVSCLPKVGIIVTGNEFSPSPPP